MKRFVGLLLTFCLLVSLCVPAFAADTENMTEGVLAAAEQEKIIDIPIFVTLTGENELTEEQKDEATASVAKYCNGEANYFTNGAVAYQVTQLDEEQKLSVLNNPIYTLTFKQIAEILIAE